MTAPLLHVDQLSKRFGGFVALDGIDLEVPPGERLGLIGPNGSGKSTLVNCICGTLQNETGSVTFAGETDRRHGRASAHAPRAGAQFPTAAALSSASPSPRISACRCSIPWPRGQAAISRPPNWTTAATSCSSWWRSTPRPSNYTRDLTQVEMRKLELARAMAAEPKLLIADESMAGLSHSEVEDIVALLIRLNERGITIIMIEHIMRAVMSFSQRLVVLVSGKKIADGKPDEVIKDPGSREGVYWPIASPSRISTPPTAPCGCCKAFRSASAAARPWCCSAPTATAKAR